ncbi:hypothetical protein [Aliivibrio fischeri]|uniref:hypothetical protein n=1 Tax=Aliivibrio fischeri TaxID=668 RepID=UPI0007C58046|nr:hypothetical protein [Aliivibrio fischeri]
MKNTTLLPLSALKSDLEDLETTLANGCYGYGAIVSFNFANRQYNRQNKVMTFVIVGDDLDHALSEFKNEDRSSGMNEYDFMSDVMSIQLEVEG